MKLRCGECASKNIKKVNQRNQRFTWKDYPSVLLSQDFKAHQCLDCKELIFSANDSTQFDQVIKDSIKDQVSMFISTILSREKKSSQTIIASRLGITPQYLSEFKSGRKQPAFGVFNFLKTLAVDKKTFKESEPEYLSQSLIKKLA